MIKRATYLTYYQPMKKPSGEGCSSRNYDSPAQQGNQSGSTSGLTSNILPTGKRREAKAGTKRAQMIEAMHLRYDPFSSGVSEKDLAPDFGSIYVDLQPGLLAELQQPQPSYLFADYGMGKTATRTALEYAVRLTSRPRTLSVTYTPRIAEQEATDEYSLQRLLDAITIELRVDLLVQYIERLPERAATDTANLDLPQREALQRQARVLPDWFKAAMRTALVEPQPDGAFWRSFRPVVRYTAVSAEWRSLVEMLVQASSTQTKTRALVPWEQTVQDARTLGFEQIYILVDAIDEGRFGASAYHKIIRPLLAASAALARQQIYLKCFLPLDLKPELFTLTDLAENVLTPLESIATIDTISPAELDRLISERFVAASRSSESFRSLDWFGQELGESVQARLIELAGGSPRRLIELASALIDFHSVHGFQQEERLWLTHTEWEKFLQTVERALSPYG